MSSSAPYVSVRYIVYDVQAAVDFSIANLVELFQPAAQPPARAV